MGVEKLLRDNHILVAEDNATNQFVVSEMLKKLGATFDMADDGLEAIALFESHDYDLALLDIEMPRKSGLDVIRHIRDASKVTAQFPIIALTAYVLDEHRTKIMDAGANHIIAKPITDIENFGHTLALYTTSSAGAPKTNEFEIRAEALSDLKDTLGADVMNEFVRTLRDDLAIIKDSIITLGDSESDREKTRESLHKLISLAGMSGATSLLCDTRAFHDQVRKCDQQELIESKDRILVGIDYLLNYLSEDSKNA